jgi:uncharacterized repeat protein (TIGR01451 family)
VYLAGQPVILPALVVGLRRAPTLVGLVAAATLALAPAASANTYSVSNTTDAGATDPSTGCATSLPGGACTLRSAIQAADVAGGLNTITLAAGDYKLTIAPVEDDDVSNGDLNVTNDDQLTITGTAGAGSTTIDANFLDRAFNVDTDGSALTLTGVSIENGRPGGLGDVTTCPATPPNGSADGGAILSGGPLTLTNDAISGNLAPGAGGGVAFEAGPGDQTSALIMTGTVVSHNTTCDNDGGDGENDGGGIYEDSGFGVTNSISDSTIDDNTVPSDGGSGGGIAAEGLAETMDVTASSITNNVAAGGAGVYDNSSTEGPGTISFFADTIAGNSTDSTETPGDRGRSRPHAVPDSNSFGPGGGVLLGFDSLSMIDSTVTANAATDGGGIATYVGPATVSFSTITGNSAVGSPGNEGNSTGNLEAINFGEGGGSFTLDDSIVANGSSPSGNPTDCNDGSSLFGGISSEGNNLFDDTADAGAECGAVSSDVVKAFSSFHLGSLANNGGPTETEALQLGSPAIDAANESKCASETVFATGGAAIDQRGVTRPQGPACDIGAYEYQQADVAITSGASPTTIDAGQQTTVTDTIVNNGYSNDSSVTFSDPISGHLTIDSAGSSQGSCSHTASTVSCDLGALAVGGKATVSITLTGNTPGTLTLESSTAGKLPDPVLSNNHSGVTIRVLGADLALKKTASPRNIIKGHKTTFTLTVKNRGLATDTDVVLTDKLPNGLKFDSDHPSQGSCSGSADIKCRLGTLKSGKRATVTVTVTGTQTGKIRNTGHVTGKLREPNLKNNKASATVTVSAPPCVENLVFRTGFDPSAHIGTVKIYEDGRLSQTLHGSNLRRVKARPVPATGMHSITVMFVIDPFRTVTATRMYNGCSSGPTHFSYPPQTNPGSS